MLFKSTSADWFDDEPEVDPKTITGPGIPEYKEGEPEEYLETRTHWLIADHNKDGVLKADDLENYFYTQFYANGGVLRCGNDTTDRARAETDGQGLLEELDENKDGQLDFKEYTRQFVTNMQHPDDEDEEEEEGGERDDL